jgi:hypothetical protein
LIESAARKKDKEAKEASEYGKVVQSYRQKGDAKGEARALQEFARENAEAEAASRALTELTQQAATTLKAIKDQANDLKEQMKRINS